MKYFFTLALLIGAFTAFSQSIDGNWKGTRETPNGAMETNYTFKVEGTTLTGSWKTQRGETKIEKGKVDGKKFTFEITFGDNSIPFTGELVNDNEIVLKNERGDSKLTRVKP